MAGMLAVACKQVDPGYSGRASASWIAQLSDSSAAERIVAANALGQVLELNPRYRPAVEALIGALRDTADAYEWRRPTRWREKACALRMQCRG